MKNFSTMTATQKAEFTRKNALNAIKQKKSPSVVQTLINLAILWEVK